MKERILPIGSVVLLKEATKPIMVIGYLPKLPEENKTFDYSACLYPEGLISSEQVLVFNDGQIEKVIHTGYRSEEQEKLFDKLSELI